uniref:RRM domain-containing protein n=1 Tax=Parascaris univalens TaxID=6257 RepID=A0A915BJF6_PARUN
MQDLAPSNYVRLRGLPFSAKEDDVRNFLQGLYVRSVTFTLTATGRASGECYVELTDAAAVEEAKKFDKKEMSSRYIEVFSVSESEVSWMIRHGVIKSADSNGTSTDTSNNYVVRLRGIPFSATVADIKEFFSGLDVADVVIDKEPGGRPSGEAFVRLANKQHAEMALERNKKNMGTRYVEVFRSSGEEMESAQYITAASRRGMFPAPRGEPIPLRGLMAAGGYRDRYGYGAGGPMRAPMGRGRPGPYDVPYDRFSRYGGGFGGYEEDMLDYDVSTKVYMRGLPYNANALDIEDFFKPLNCVEIRLGYNEDRRPSGDAYVLFSTMAEARDALSRNKKTIGTRYIELFSGANVPPPQRYVTYRRIGGTGGGAGASSYGGGRAASLSRSAGYTSFEDDDYGYGGGYGGGQQYFNDEYESRQSSYGRQWGGGASIKAAW